MDKYFKGKRILVTGGCRGIGYGIAEELWRLGAAVVVITNIAENVQKLKAQYPTIEVVCVDLRDWVETKECVDSLGVFDGLVNNAGVVLNQPFLECTKELFDDTFAINTRAVVNVSQIVAKKMIQNGIKGSIVNVSSQASKAALKDHVSYCGSKAAVDGITRVMALELGPFGIRANTVNPTVVMTELGRKAWSEPSKSQEMLSKIPLGRFGEVHEVVNAVMFLLSDKASMISGVHLPVDGGFLAC
ncbi:L-xylulose reductase [Amyelois transitella]|uniref:L-xylulose reductase n=1 Tax=Amyelois transitella TaxID=680683 RepID=UPI00067D4201|nr:L-xylulose reductase [Amyelois transitella]